MCYMEQSTHHVEEQVEDHQLADLRTMHTAGSSQSHVQERPMLPHPPPPGGDGAAAQAQAAGTGSTGSNTGDKCIGRTGKQAISV